MTSEVTQAFEAEHDGDTFTIRFPDGHSITAWANGKLIVTKDAAGFRPFESSVSRLTAQSGEGRSGAGEDALREAVRRFLPTNINLDAVHLPDEATIPLDVTMGELRGLRAALTARQSGEGERDQ